MEEEFENIKGFRFCLLDTDVLLKLFKPSVERKRKSQGLQRFFQEFFTQDYKPMITDMSFVELVSGCSNLNDFKKAVKDIKDCEIIITGFSKELRDYIQPQIQDEAIDSIDFDSFKDTVLDLREKEMASYFEKILIRYTGVFFACLNYSKDERFHGLFNEYVNFLKDNEGLVNSIIDETYKKAYRKEISYNNLLIEIMAYMVALMISKKDTAVDFESLYSEINQLNFQQLMEKYIVDNKIVLLDFFNSKKDRLFTLLKHFRVFKDQNNLYGTVIFDAFTYSMLNSGFCGGKFVINDLVDIYNLSFIANNDNEFSYFTDDKRWNNFILMESFLDKDFAKRVIGNKDTLHN